MCKRKFWAFPLWLDVKHKNMVRFMHDKKVHRKSDDNSLWRRETKMEIKIIGIDSREELLRREPLYKENL